MGRKKKPAHLQRTPCTVSLPLEIHKHLFEITKKGLTVSRYIEGLIRREIDGNTKQTNLQRHVFSCPNPECEREFWHSNDRIPDFVWCVKCQSKAEYHGPYDEKEWADDEGAE